MKKFTLPFIVALAALLFTCPYLMADEEPDWFTITNNSASNFAISFYQTNPKYGNAVTIQFRILDEAGTVTIDWTTKTMSNSSSTSSKTTSLGTIPAKGKMQVRGNNPNGINKSTSYTNYFNMPNTFCDISGNILSLVAYDATSGTINNNYTMPAYCFYNIFNSSTTLKIQNAQDLELPSTTLAEGCYKGLFRNCTTLVTAPKVLPATALPIYCYDEMFYNNVTNGARLLTKSPDIMATSFTGNHTASNHGLHSMFGFNSGGTDRLSSIRVYWTSWTANASSWVTGTQTSAGSFYCPPQLSREHGNSWIPSKWKVYSYDLTFHLQSGSWTDETSEDRQYTWRTDVSDVTTFLTNEVTAGTRFYSDAACTSELTQSYIESQLSELQNTTTWTIYVNGGTAPAGASTHTVTLADDATGYGSVDATEISEVEDGENITIDGNTLTIGTTTVTATPTTADAQYTYTFTGWTDGEGNSLPATLTGDLTVVAHFTRTTNTYAIRFLNGETVLQNTQVEYGTTPAYDGSTPTKDADNEYTYTFNAWTPAIYSVDRAQDYTATFTQTKQQYTLTWVTDGNELTGSYTTGTMDWGASITAPDTPTKPGKDFAGWRSSISSNVEDPASTMPTQDLTYTATWTDAAVRTLDLYDDRDATYYNNIKALNDQTYDVTYHRSVAYTSDNGNARWYTLCLPFDVDQSQLDINGLTGKVYEYRYAEGSADENDHVTFHFRAVKSPNYMLAGQGYLVKATGDMGPDFTFTDVTLNTSADVVNGNVDNLKNSNAYKESGDIAIVGVLRNGTLSNDGRKVMGLANNKIWYPHSSGNPMPAYRAYFYNPNASASSVMPRVRIVVEGEDTTELEVVDGELYDAGGYNADGDGRGPSGVAKKYIRNGVLIIERNGVRYDAQGKRL